MNRETILKLAKDFTLKNRSYPSIVDMKILGVTRDQIRSNFGNLTQLQSLLSEHSGLMDLNRKQVKTDLGKNKTFVITTAVCGAEVNVPFYNALQSYCEKERAKLLILPSTVSNTLLVDPVLKDETFIMADTRLNRRISILGIKNSAKTVDPITGLPRVGQRNGSFIAASPKQRLKFVPTGPNSLPHALMSTGAITSANYKFKGPLIDKSNYLANNDHMTGAIIVELDKNDIFHFRQIQADKNGNFADLGKLYKSNGKVENYVPACFVIGDYHSGETDQVAEKTWLNISQRLGINKWIIHDGFNSASISHHDIGKFGSLAKKSLANHLSLKDELDNYGKDLIRIGKTVSELVIVKSNHDEHLDRYLNEARYVKDPQNHRLSLDLAAAYIDGKNPLSYYMNTKPEFKGKKIKWLEQDESYIIAGIQLGAHGDKGANGARGSLKSIEEAYGNSVSGHSHSPEILRGAWRVGTTSLLKLDYNVGPSSWFHTSCLVYPNGQRQLINCVQGLWTTKKI